MDPIGSNARHDTATGTNATGAASTLYRSASAHTAAQIHGWTQAGIERADLAIRRPDGAMLWHYDCPLADLPLPWAKAHNVRQADVYIRPARGYSWPLVFLDDVTLDNAQRIARKYAAMVVHTSPSGGCHVWLCVNAALHEHQRYQAQRWLASRVGADPGSVSGEHLGRLAGMKNHKRNGVWVNLLDCDNTHAPPWDPTPALQSTGNDNRCSASTRSRAPSTGVDCSESARQWGWVCGALKAGISPDSVYRQLVERASHRRGRDAERYASYTIKRAILRMG